MLQVEDDRYAAPAEENAMTAHDMMFRVVKGNEAPFRSTKDALAWARTNGLIGRMADTETGGKGVVSISAESIRETLNPRQREKSISDRVHFAALAKLRELIREGWILESHEDWPKGKDGNRHPEGRDERHGITICIAYAAFMLTDVVYRVRLTLKRYAQTGMSKAYAYRVNEIEVVPGTLGGKIALATNPTDTTSICGTILLQGALTVNGVPLLQGRELSDLLTIVIPVKNEERNLPACLENVKDFTSVILVDSGSTDRTREIFEGIRDQGSGIRDGWEIVDFKWNGKFPKKRNWTLRNYRFKTPWVMFLDADERMTEEWKREAEKLLAGTAREDTSSTGERVDAWICSYDNWFLGRMLRYGDVMQKTAILRVGRGEYEKIDEDNWSSLDMEIHEHLQVEGKIGTIKSHLEHHDKRSFESHVAKHREYAKWEANRYRQLMDHPERWDALTPRQKVKYRNLTKWWLAPAYFAVCYFRKLGFLDGSAGLRFALFKAWYFALVRRTIGHLV